MESRILKIAPVNFFFSFIYFPLRRISCLPGVRCRSARSSPLVFLNLQGNFHTAQRDRAGALPHADMLLLCPPSFPMGGFRVFRWKSSFHFSPLFTTLISHINNALKVTLWPPMIFVKSRLDCTGNLAVRRCIDNLISLYFRLIIIVGRTLICNWCRRP